MLKTALFDCAINEKCCSVDPPWGICQFKSPHPRNFPPKAKKKTLMPGGSAQGEAGAAGID